MMMMMMMMVVVIMTVSSTDNDVLILFSVNLSHLNSTLRPNKSLNISELN